MQVVLRWLSEREGAVLLLILAGGVIFRLAAVAAFSHVPESDELAYRAMALNFLAGNGIVDQMGNRAMYNVGYPLFVLTPGFLLSPDNLYVVRALNVFLGAVAIILCHRVARELGAGVVGRLLAATFWSFYLPAAVYVVYLAKENLMIPLVLGVAYYALRLLKAPSRASAVGCGTCLGLLALTGNAALSLVAMVAFALFFAGGSKGGRAKLAMLVLVPAIVVPAPWVIRNAMVLGAPVLNTNGGFNLYLGNNPSATGMFVSIGDTPRGADWQELRQQGEIYASSVLRKEAIEWIVDNPMQFASLSGRKLVYFWTPPLHQGSGEKSMIELVVRMFWAFQFVLIAVAALATLFCQRRRSERGIWMLWLGVVSYSAVHMLFYVIFRYREPIMPILCILAAMAIDNMLFKNNNIDV